MVKITTKTQFECLVSLMEDNTVIAKGFNKSLDKNEVKDFWKKVETKLNSLGPPLRDCEGWQKVWNDFKLKIKKKMALTKTQKQCVFSSLEVRVIRIADLEKVVKPKERSLEPAPSLEDTDIPLAENSLFIDIKEELPCFDDTDMPLVENSSFMEMKEEPLLENKTQTQNQIIRLLEAQTEVQRSLYDKVTKRLDDIEQITEENGRVWRKILKLKEEKLDIYKRTVRENAEYKQQKLKLQLEKLELRKLKLKQMQAQ